MKYQSMTARELIHYLDLYNTDPVVRLLLEKISHEDYLTELIDLGMDSNTYTFRSEYGGAYTLGEYIRHLRESLQGTEDELDELKYKYDDLQETCDELKTRTIMDFVEEVRQERQTNQELVKEAMGVVQSYKKENERLKEQIDMWARMNQIERAPE